MLRLVSRRTKTIILLLGICAILYVLISPLPEMDATNSVRLDVVAVVFLPVLFIILFTSLFSNTSGGPRSRLELSLDLQATFCSRLC
jgi:hypothetical protein